MWPWMLIPTKGDESSVVRRVKCHLLRSSPTGEAAKSGLGLRISSRRSYWSLLVAVAEGVDGSRAEESGGIGAAGSDVACEVRLRQETWVDPLLLVDAELGRLDLLGEKSDARGGRHEPCRLVGRLVGGGLLRVFRGWLLLRRLIARLVGALALSWASNELVSGAGDAVSLLRSPTTATAGEDIYRACLLAGRCFVLCLHCRASPGES